MKKRKIIERRKALKEAYYNELKKAGVIDTPKVKTLDEMTKKELIELALSEGLELDNKLTKAVMIEMINNHINSEETNDETPVLVIQDADNQDNVSNEEQDAPTQEQTPADGTIEDIDIPDITEEQVQAVANAIVEQAEEDNKPINQVVNEIVEESKEETPIEVH